MTQRSITAGVKPRVVVKAGASVTIRTQETELVTAETTGLWGLQLEKHDEAQIARARAAIGEHVLFDLRFKRPGWDAAGDGQDIIEVQFGGSGEVKVPAGSNIKVYAGRDIDIQGIQGIVDAYAGHNLSLRNVYCVGNASAGASMLLECETALGSSVEFKAGGDLRVSVHDLISARMRVRDLGGYWEALIGSGERSITLKSGGDVTVVTDQKVEPLPPNFVLGKIEKPAAA